MHPHGYLQNVLVGATALVIAGGHFVRSAESGPIATPTIAAPTVSYLMGAATDSAAKGGSGTLAGETAAALAAIAGDVRRLSHPAALEDAFRSYFAYKTAHPDAVKKPYLYFVDYGLPSTTPRGYLFDMQALKVIDGPFMVAHGRGSSKAHDGVPTRFSNGFGAATTSLGLYVAQELYDFVGHAGGQTYSSIGLRLNGVSTGFNDNARARGVVAHGAPYVTATRAGRSEGCPAMESSRAQRLLPKLANGGMVFLFAPDTKWMADDPWLAANAG
jgi:hypothetical protein